MAEMDVNEVLAHLPQRFPMMMLDRVTQLEAGKRIVALKNVSANEPYFQGHFPQRPIMPGVLILQAMAQAAGTLVFPPQPTNPHNASASYSLALDHPPFKNPGA